MDAINEKIYKANIQLQDENKVLKEDKKILQKRIDKAIEYIESCTWSNGIDNELQYSLHIPSLLKILKGEYFNE